MSYVETGLLRLDDDEDRKTHNRKQMRYVYVYGTHTEALRVVVTADLNDEIFTAEYEVSQQGVTNPRATRCEVGRGFATNYAKFRFGGRSRFTISAIEIESVVSNRRV